MCEENGVYVVVFGKDFLLERLLFDVGNNREVEMLVE